MVNKLNREGYPNLFAEMAMANSAVKGLFEVFQSNPKAVVGGNSDSRQLRVPIALGSLSQDGLSHSIFTCLISVFSHLIVQPNLLAQGAINSL